MKGLGAPAKWKPAKVPLRPAIGADAKLRHGLTPTTANAAILGVGLLLGLVTYQYRESPLGATLLGAAGSLSAVALVLFLRDLLVVDGGNPLLTA